MDEHPPHINNVVIRQQKVVSSQDYPVKVRGRVFLTSELLNFLKEREGKNHSSCSESRHFTGLPSERVPRQGPCVPFLPRREMGSQPGGGLQ